MGERRTFQKKYLLRPTTWSDTIIRRRSSDRSIVRRRQSAGLFCLPSEDIRTDGSLK